jgi:hypothetical protein
MAGGYSLSIELMLMIIILDALTGFTQVTVKKRDREKTAFRTHEGLHHFSRMPFGLRNGLSTFQRSDTRCISTLLMGVHLGVY